MSLRSLSLFSTFFFILHVFNYLMFHTKSQPKLKGKAAEVKDLGPVMVLVWEKHMNCNLQIHQKILVVLKGFCFSSNF